ncbi:MAG: hypothetical protein QXL89_03145 [Nitrososphaeria archaeon]
MSSTFLNKELPIILIFVTGVIMIVSYFVSAPEIYLDPLASNLSQAAALIAAYATILGILTLAIIHVNHIIKRTKGQWVYSIVVLALALLMIVVGFIGELGTHPYFIWLYQYPLIALDTTIYSLLAFYIVSAAFRAFKVRSVEALILVVAGIFVMLMNAPVGAAIWSGFPTIGNWVMSVPNTSGFRGFIIGAAIGAIAIGLRVLLGKEKGVLGRS